MPAPTTTSPNPFQSRSCWPGCGHSCQEILNAVWGAQWVGDDNMLDIYIRALRRKLEREGRSTLIQTVRGVGFMLKEALPKA